MTVAAAYFHNSFFNQIGYAVTDYQTFEGTFLNIGKTRARGLELTVRAIPGKHWEVTGGYTYLDSTILTSSSPFDPVYATGQQLLRRPANSGYLDLRWNPRRWSFGATALMVGAGSTPTLRTGDLKNPGYLLLNVVSDFRVNKYLSVYAFVGNVLNTDYMEVFGYPALRSTSESAYAPVSESSARYPRLPGTPASTNRQTPEASLALMLSLVCGT